MFQLKPYQQTALDELKQFLNDASTLKGSRGIRLAFLDKAGEEGKAYKPIPQLEETPFVCIKIPTGGGKTVVACHSLSVILDNYLQEKNGTGLVMWFVPSDAIRNQTLKALKDRNHPYREALDSQFGNNIKIFTVEEALSIQKSDIQNNLCIVVSSLAAFRRNDKLWLKVFQSNGALLSHFENLVEDTNFLDKDEEGGIYYSLANVIKINSPIVVLDEGHNAQTPLSFEMLQNLNPSFIIEYTATPRQESNVLVEISASELKAQKMVKIPIWLSNVSQWQETIRDGINQLKELEKLAQKEKRETKEYIRPIMLLQAEQEKESESKIYVDQIKEFLISELKISENEIAIKTSKQDEISNIDLLSPKCNIRYIITVNALKEGWDCPFAYVLVSVANIGSTIAVEQTIGRIMRLPNAVEKKNLELNNSYVFTSSENFRKASDAIIKGLEQHGYSREDLKENKGKIVVEKEEYKQVIKDDNINIPMFGLKGRTDSLAFNRDLIGNEFMLDEYYKPFDINFHEDQNRKAVIDIDEKNGLFKITQGKLSLILYPEDFSLEEVTNWLKRNVRKPIIASEEMARYIDLLMKDLSKTHSVEELSLNRFRLKERIAEEVSKIIQEYATKRFDGLLNKGEITVDSAYFTPEKEISLARVSQEHFNKHLFEKAGNLNGEETELASRLDIIDNIEWWYRNREKEDFYLQGWQSGKFYPDIIVKTKNGDYLLLEYKGEDRLSNEDTAYKVKLGELWEKLNGNGNKFYLVSKTNLDDVLKQITFL